ncbi:hypothetical protein MSKU3_0501 [Komagataeibacter oboediens]|nr:hypothetical protein MSKU3_0501 [Komagataeibacter oboediens]
MTFFPSDRREAPGREKGVGHHGHQYVSVQASLLSPPKVIEAQFFLELLLCLTGTKSSQVQLPTASRMCCAHSERPDSSSESSCDHRLNDNL